MATKARRKKKGGFKVFLLALFFVFTTWAAAFLVWLFWSDIEKLSGFGVRRPAPQQAPKQSKEKISEGERKKLDDVIKRRERQEK
ncbi:MAG: YfhO family protein [Deltaproteobacteria bacterium]|nr:MAG: YfhO family protein [Deltaproteobacteria bacterium]